MSAKTYTTAAMAPTQTTAVKPSTGLSATGMPIRPSVIFRSPVEEELGQPLHAENKGLADTHCAHWTIVAALVK